MAEVAVNLAVEHLIPFLIEEAKLLKGVRGEVEFIRDEMDSIRVLLKDADARAEIDGEVKVWVKQLRLVAFRMEDVLDEFRLRVAQQPLRSGVLGWVRKSFGCVKSLKPRHVVASEVQDIKGKLIEISVRKERYQFKRSVPELDKASFRSYNRTGSWRNISALYTDELEIVGIDKPRNQLVDWLIEGQEKRSSVFAVVGTGGVGKTTMVRKVYESDQVKSHFHYRAWITVSQSFKIENLLMGLIKQFHESRKESFSLAINEEMERTYLIDLLRNYLQDKRYVVILDDVWSVELWDFLKYALLDNHCDSRIVVTTRANDVASSFVESSSHILPLHPLPLEDALLLFYKKAFGSNFRGQYPPELEELSKDIVKRSGRLPLAIVAMGGLLLTKDKTVLEWKKFRDSLSSKFGEDPKLKTIMKIISLSYHDLPYYLKPCFLYFGIIPEDLVFPSHALISCWISEGFLKKEKGKTLEEVAEDYLEQLISRNLVMVEESEDGYVLKCKVHDLMREFILSRFIEENFCEVLDGKSTPSSYETNRRLSIQNNTGAESVMKSINSFSLVRSVYVFVSDELPASFVHTVISAFTQLKILDLCDTHLDTLPDEVSNLFHLRYLDLTNTPIKELPNSIGRLQNLETLFLTGTCLVELPRAILKLQNLRHITAYHQGNNKAVKVPEGIGCLTELQTLYNIDEKGSPSLIKDLEKLVELRHLRISNLRRESGMKLCSSLAKMNSLKSFAACSIEEEVLDLQFVSSPPLLLQSLYLDGRLEKFSDWVVSLTNLTYMALTHSRLSDHAMETVQDLPNLQELFLQTHSYDGDELHFHSESFPKLKCIALTELDMLHSVVIEKGAMPTLKELSIENCEQLKVIPEGIEHLTNLKALFILYMPINFTRRLEEDEGEDYRKVKHIPSIVIKWDE